MVFSGRPLWTPTQDRTTANFQDLILRPASTAFWGAYLKGDKRARAFLTDGGLQKVLGKDATFEKKRRCRAAAP